MRLINAFLIGLLIPSMALAGLPPTTIKGQTDVSPKTKFGFQVPHNQATDLGGISSLIETGNTNILKNPGFEDTSIATWTASGGIVTNNSTSKATGTKGLSWDSDSASQTLVSDLIVVPNGFQGNNGYAYCNIKTVSGTATHTFTVDNGTTNIVTPVTINSSTDRFQRTSVNFVYPSSGSIRIKITSVAANEPNIYIDDCYLGEATNVSSVSQAQLVGTVKVTGCASPWSTTSTTFASFATQAGCSYAVTGQALAPTTNIPAIRFANLAPGDYRIEYEGSLYTSATAGRQDAYFQFYDGSNEYREVSTIGGTTVGDFKPNFSASYTYTAPQSNITLQVRAKTSNSQTTFIYGTTAQPGVIRVYYFPSQSQLAVSSAQTDYDWTSFTPTYSASFGTVTGSSCYKKRRGPDLLVKCTGITGTVTAAIGSIDIPDSLVLDTTKNPSLSGLQGNSAVGLFYQDGAANRNAAIVTLPATSTTKVYVGPRSSDTAILAPQNMNNFYGSSEEFSLNFTVPIVGWSENQRAPTLIGSVTSNASGAERLERAQVTSSCTSSPCTIASQSGSWLTNITRSTTGTYAINYPSGTFSAAPTCVCNSSISQNRFCSTQSATTTSVSILMTDQTNTLLDSAFNILCMGAR
jgi:hypothetical protein